MRKLTDNKPVAKATDPIDEPTRSSVQRLLDMLTLSKYDIQERIKDDPAVRELAQQIEELEEELSRDKGLQELKRKKEAAEKKAEDRLIAISNEAKKVEKAYYARGLTPKVREMVEALAEYEEKQ